MPPRPCSRIPAKYVPRHSGARFVRSAAHPARSDESCHVTSGISIRAYRGTILGRNVARYRKINRPVCRLMPRGNAPPEGGHRGLATTLGRFQETDSARPAVRSLLPPWFRTRRLAGDKTQSRRVKCPLGASAESRIHASKDLETTGREGELGGGRETAGEKERERERETGARWKKKSASKEGARQERRTTRNG